MRKDILALAIVKKGGGGGQLDDGLYNVKNGNATNLVNKVAMSAANGKMFASGDRSTTNGIMYYLTTNPYEIKNIQGPELGNGKIYYLWGASGQGIIKREYVQPRKYYYADPNGNTMLTEIPEPVTPSGSLSITQNGTYDVTDKAQAVVNIPQPSGRKILYAAGGLTYNVTNYAQVDVIVEGLSSLHEGENVPNYYLYLFHKKVLEETANFYAFIADDYSSELRLSRSSDTYGVRLSYVSGGNGFLLGTLNMDGSNNPNNWSLSTSYIFRANDGYKSYNARTIIPIAFYSRDASTVTSDADSDFSEMCWRIEVENTPETIEVDVQDVIDHFFELLGINLNVDHLVYFMTLNGYLVRRYYGGVLAADLNNSIYVDFPSPGSGSGSGSGY